MSSSRDKINPKPKKSKKEKERVEDDDTDNPTASQAPSGPQRTGTTSSVESQSPSTGLAKIKSRLKKSNTDLSTKSTGETDEERKKRKEDAKNTIGKIVAQKMRDSTAKLSITKILNTVMQNMTVTPAMRSGRFKANPVVNPAAGKGKQRESSSESEEEEDADVEVVIYDEDEARRGEAPFYVIFHVPLDKSNDRMAFAWKGSENYPLIKFNEEECHRGYEKYLTSVLNDVTKPVSKKNPKNTLTVGLHFHEAMKEYDDYVAEDVKKCLDTLVRMLKFAKLRIVCRFIPTHDPRLGKQEYQVEAANMTAVIIQTLIDQIAVAGEGWMSTGLIPISETRHTEDPFTATKDFADGSKLRDGEVIGGSMYRTTDAEQWLAFHERARLEPQPRHLVTGTEADDVITPAPKPKFYDE